MDKLTMVMSLIKCHPAGYAFLLFKNESSVHKLLLACKPEGDKHFIYMPTSTLTKKKVR